MHDSDDENLGGMPVLAPKMRQNPVWRRRAPCRTSAFRLRDRPVTEKDGAL